jgi:cyclopropane fatty-acyl-phospholipid synthase-like methyltransferase
MSKIFERYLQQDYLTPGALETVDLAREHFALSATSSVLEVAFGKGTTAITLAAESGCRVTGVDSYPGFVSYAWHRVEKAGLAGRIAFIRADGGALPVRDAAFDAAICIGAPSIVGTERCLAAMHRALRPGGMIAVSDWTWRTSTPPPEAVPVSVKPPFVTTDDYAAAIRQAGFEIIHGEPMPQRVWDDYYAPLRTIIADVRAETPDAPEDVIETEVRAYDAGGEHWAYAAFVARKK